MAKYCSASIEEYCGRCGAIDHKKLYGKSKKSAYHAAKGN